VEIPSAQLLASHHTATWRHVAVLTCPSQGEVGMQAALAHEHAGVAADWRAGAQWALNTAPGRLQASHCSTELPSMCSHTMGD